MKPRSYRLMDLANLAVGGTGVVYGILRYFMTGEGEYGPEAHPAQPLWQHLHVLAAPALVLMAGVFWASHVHPYLPSAVKEGRRSGLAMACLALPMIFSGYAIQVAMHETWRAAWIVLHVTTGLLWIALFGAHWTTHWLGRTAARDQTTREHPGDGAADCGPSR